MQNHPLMILGTTTFLNTQPDIRVTGSSITPEEYEGKLKEARPDVVIFELSIAGPFQFSHLEELHRAYPELPVLVYSYHEEVIFARRAIDAGASGYLMKEAQPDQLAEAIRRVLAGEIYLSGRVKNRIQRENEAARTGEPFNCLNGSFINSFSNRELQIFQFLGDGCSKEDIRNRLEITPQSLDSALYRMRRKLGLPGTPELMQFAAHWVYYEGDFS